VQIMEYSNSVVVGTNRFVWAGSQMYEEMNGANSVTRRFFAEGEQIGGTNYYFTFDHLGSVREMTDTNGTIHARYGYDPYGQRSANQITTNAVGADFGFTGYYVHQPSGLQLALYRAYDPDTGRWPNKDPISESGFELLRQRLAKTTTTGGNLYLFVANDPESKIDLFGLCSCGPDITPILNNTLSDVERQFNNPATDQKTVCANFNSEGGWEITGLVTSRLSSPCGASGDCV
jgi:RHS repeat-associated protein